MYYALAVWAAMIGVFADNRVALAISVLCLVAAVIKDDRLYRHHYTVRRKRV